MNQKVVGGGKHYPQNFDVLDEALCAISQGIVVIGETEFDYVSPNTSALLEVPEDYLQAGKPWRDYFNFLSQRGDYGDGAVAQKKLDHVIEQIRQCVPYCHERLTPSGKWISFEGLPRDGAGMIFVVTDISGRMSMVQQSSAAKRKAEAYAAFSADFFWEVDDHLRFNVLSDNCDGLFWDSQKHIIGKTLRELGVNGVPKRELESHFALMEAHEPFRDFAFSVRFADGSINWIAVSGAPQFDEVGQFTGYIGSGRIVTEEIQHKNQLVKMAKQLEQGKKRMETFATIGADWFWEMDANLAFTYFSETFSHITGVPQKTLLGKTRRQTRVPNIDAKAYEAHLRQLDNQQPFRDFIYPRTKKDGTKVWLSISGNPIYDEDNNFAGYMGTGSDVTERINQQMELERAQKKAELGDKAKSEFLANMSHEIRTPMNGVMGMAELLAKTELNSKQKMFTDVIVKSGASLLTIINDILDFSKIGAGQLSLDPVEFKLSDAVEDVATMMAAKVAEKDLELIVRVEPSLPKMIVGDVGRVRQILTNTIGNAVKFTEQGHVFINVSGSVADQDGQPIANIKFEVKDTGIGISKEDIERVFDKFSQVDGSATRRHEGTGLGLAITHSLVSLMGGKMDVQSEEGVGSVFAFQISFPVAKLHAPAEIPCVDLSKYRVLVVDDNTVNLSILEEQLAAWQLDLATAKSGPEALAIMGAAIDQGVGIDCIVLDNNMPDMNGGQVVDAMRNDLQLAKVPVILLTSFEETYEGKSFSSLDVQATLLKPSRSSHLLGTIIRVLQQAKAADSVGYSEFRDEIRNARRIAQISDCQLDIRQSA